MLPRPLALAALALAALAAACGSDDPTGPSAGDLLPGAPSGAEIGVVLNSVGRSLSLFQAGAPTVTRALALSATGSSAPTPTTFALRGARVAVPLGDAASTAVLDLRDPAGVRYYTFAAGNATGAAWVDDNTVLVANLVEGYVGRVDASRAGGAVADTLRVAPAPTAIVMAAGRALVVSSNLDPKNGYRSLGRGVVTAVDPRTMRVTGTVAVGDNPTAAALGPDGKLYVVNSEGYATGSVSIVDPQQMTLEATVAGFGAGPGAIVVDANGLAYVSGYGIGTIVWNTRTRAFVRGPDNPVCARAVIGGRQQCRGAAAAAVGEDGTLYQAFSGDFGAGVLKPYVFVYRPTTFQLADSVAAGTDPTAIDVRAFR
jgi:DNA-binding beta-propeller fold protein YncE